MKRLIYGLVPVIILVSALAPHVILANIHSNTIDPVALLTTDGKVGTVIALIECSSGERVMVRVTVTQEDANSVAEGRGYATCTGSEQRIPVRVLAQMFTKLSTGAADACALATTRRGLQVTDTRQWCKAVTLNDH